jgi:hypothetical protein
LRRIAARILRAFGRPGQPDLDRADPLDILTADQLRVRVRSLTEQVHKLRVENAELATQAECSKKQEQVWKSAVDQVYQKHKEANAGLIFAQEAAARGLKNLLENDQPIPPGNKAR